jgi:hypothetical protein
VTATTWSCPNGDYVVDVLDVWRRQELVAAHAVSCVARRVTDNKETK